MMSRANIKIKVDSPVVNPTTEVFLTQFFVQLEGLNAFVDALILSLAVEIIADVGRILIELILL